MHANSNFLATVYNNASWENIFLLELSDLHDQYLVYQQIHIEIFLLQSEIRKLLL